MARHEFEAARSLNQRLGSVTVFSKDATALGQKHFPRIRAPSRAFFDRSL